MRRWPTYPHRIRLRGPWEYETPAKRGRVTLPAALIDVGLSPGDEVRLRRRFGYPGRIDPGERVWLVVEAAAAPLDVSLNGGRLGGCVKDAEWDVTDRLSARNELLVVTAAGGVPWGECGLVVRRTAYLRDLRVWAEGATVFASGEVVGRAEGSLDLYLVADRRTAAYVSVSATDGGTRFALSGECEAGPPRSAKVELVQGAVAWYTAEIDLAGEPA